MGYFFSACDGYIDERETQFVNQFIERVQENHKISNEKVEELRNIVDENIDIDVIIGNTKELLTLVDEQEKQPLLRSLSYFIYQIIRADGIILPVEDAYYARWKEYFMLDDNTDIADLME